MRHPQPFGKYVLLERISVGGMAEVFKARPTNGDNGGKMLAIKRILPSMAEDADFIQMFIDEARISGQLHHQNIAQIYELGQFEDAHFIAMEFVWGKDLLQMQNRFRRMKQTMKPDMAAFIASRMCAGLDYAHRRTDPTGKLLGIIHRDVSPQNVLVSYDGEVKVIDFGIAKAASRATKTQAGVLKGKFGYMSPEQVRGLPLDRRSDIFAIATILYEMLTAERLFMGESDFATLEKVRNVDVPPPSKVTSCPLALEKIIMKGLTKEVEDRYAWASEMEADLNAYLATIARPFTPANLSQWMKEQFAVELKRESAIIEEQRTVDLQALLSGQAHVNYASTPGAVPASTIKPELQVNADGEIGLDVDDVQFEEDVPLDGATQITDPEMAAKLAAARPPAEPVPEGGDMVAQKTMILQDGAAAPAPGDMVAQKTMILQDGMAPPPAATDMPGQSTVMLDPATMPAPRPPAQRAQVAVAAQPGGQTSANPATSMVPPLPYKRKGTLGKDLMIGLGIAAVLVAGGVGAKVLLFGKQAVGTLVVTIAPPAAATVLVDGLDRGRMTPGTPLTIKDIPAGEHSVIVRGERGEVARQVTLVAEGIAQLGVSLPASDTMGRVRVALKTRGATVFIDGAQLEEDLLKDPIPLKPDIDHELKATAPECEEFKVKLRLKAGEDLIKEIRLQPTTASLLVTSDPTGAEVTINGKKSGETPLQLKNLDFKDLEVAVKKKGFRTFTKTVSFEKERRQEVAAKLESDAPAEAPKKEPPATAKKPAAAPEPARPAAAPVAKKPAAGAKEEQGFLVANTQPWAKVLIDGKDTGKTTPIAKMPLKAGSHKITFVANGKSYNFDVTINPGQDTRLIKQLSDAQ